MTNKWTTDIIRKTWLDFWKSKNHLIVESKSLIPVNDSSLIWINSGVATLKKYFSGIELPPSRRITNSQRAIRTNDIGNVGITSRHHTFFEMLGNFSIGDYFKKDAIKWGYELLTKVFCLPIKKLFFTVYNDDIETYNYWLKCGVSPSHIQKWGREQNFWDIGSGPCGPCTEIYFDRGLEFDPQNKGIELFKNNIENDRYVEIWNIVFSQYNNDGKNNYSDLIYKNIDTGCGLERLACVLQQVPTNFDIDIFRNVISSIEKHTANKYDIHNYFNPNTEQTQINYAFRIIADHIKTCVFAIADGATPSNKERGYIIRKLLRRAIVYAHKLNVDNSFINNVVDSIILSMKSFYPYLLKHKQKIIDILINEQNLFSNTLKNGLILFNNETKNTNVLSGKIAFKLSETYGFPIELTFDLARQKNIKIDIDEYEKFKKQHTIISKNVKFANAMDIQNPDLIDFKINSLFKYEDNECNSNINGIFNKEFKSILTATSGDDIWVTFDKTIFYARCGGEEPDIGTIDICNTKTNVLNVIKGPNGQHFHNIICPKNCSLKIGDNAKLKLDIEAKKIISAAHTSEHLLQAALQKNISKDIKQRGASKNHDKITFDFFYDKKISHEQLLKVEDTINNWIHSDMNVEIYMKTLEEAKQMGALAYFTDVYKKIIGKLRVVKIDNISCEICAGRHVKKLSEIEQFHIIKLSSKGGGVWRIEAIVSNKNVSKYIEYINTKIIEKISSLKKQINENKFINIKFIEKFNNFKISKDWYGTQINQKEIDALMLEFKKIMVDEKKKNTKNSINEILLNFKPQNHEYELLCVNDIDNKACIDLVNKLLNKYPFIGFIIANNKGNKISYFIAKSKNANNIKKANELINEINNLTNGNGGGSENFCQGSCKANDFSKFTNIFNKK